MRLNHLASSPLAHIFDLSTDKVIPRQLFEVPIQAVVGRKVIARETLKAMRADVTAGLYGGEKFFEKDSFTNLSFGCRRPQVTTSGK